MWSRAQPRASAGGRRGQRARARRASRSPPRSRRAHKPGGDAQECRRCAPAARSRGTSRTRIFATSVSTSANAVQSTTSTRGKDGELEPDVARMGQEDLKSRQHEHEPVVGCRGPLQIGEVAPGVLNSALRGSSSARGACRRCRPAAGPSRRRRRARRLARRVQAPPPSIRPCLRCPRRRRADRSFRRGARPHGD